MRVVLALLLAAVANAADMLVYGYLPEWRYLQWTPEEQEYRWDVIAERVTHIILFSLEVEKDGSLAEVGRFPPPNVLVHAKTACEKHGTKLMISLGGNGRTRGFPVVAKSKEKREVFVKNLERFLRQHKLDGVDFNWEYPQTSYDWEGLQALVRKTREVLGTDKTITVAYYPDGKQEGRVVKMQHYADHFLAMAYDQPKKHSTELTAFRSLGTARNSGIAMSQLVLGVPFYGRHIETGEWKSYADIRNELQPQLNVDMEKDWYFNCRHTIFIKKGLAKNKKLAGLMIWELGQDMFDNKARSLVPGVSLLEVLSQTDSERAEAEKKAQALLNEVEDEL